MLVSEDWAVPARTEGEQTCHLLFHTSSLLSISSEGSWLRAAFSITLNRRSSRLRMAVKWKTSSPKLGQAMKTKQATRFFFSWSSSHFFRKKKEKKSKANKF